MQTANPPKQFNTLQTYQRQFNTLQTYQRRFNTLQTYQRQLNRLPIDQKPPLEAMHPQSTETVPQGRCWCLAEGNGRGGQHLKNNCEKDQKTGFLTLKWSKMTLSDCQCVT